MSGFESNGGYSADVRLYLILDGKRLKPAQIADEFLMLDEPTVLPSGPAELIMTVDGRPTRWDIEILEMPSASKTVRFRFAQRPV